MDISLGVCRFRVALLGVYLQSKKKRSVLSMRILRVIVIGSILLFISTLGWYISQPVVIGIARQVNATVYSNVNARNTVTAIEYASVAWGPVMTLFVLLWMIYSASQRDVESQIYG